MPVNAFHILSLHRCGSRMLCNALDNHPSISCLHEGAIYVKDLALADKFQALAKGKPVVGLHSHYPQVTPEIEASPHPKIAILNKDAADGAQAEAMINCIRANDKYSVDATLLTEIQTRRDSEAAELIALADLVLYIEDITKNQEITDLPTPQTNQLLDLLELPHVSLTTTIKREREKRPSGEAKRPAEIDAREQDYAHVIQGTYPAKSKIVSADLPINDDANVASILMSRQGFKAMPTNDLFFMRCYVSRDGGVTWRYKGGASYGGGDNTSFRGYRYHYATGVTVVEPGPNRLFRVEVEVYDQPVTLDIDVDFVVR